jgi:capsular exopolysaccharide synthesis family protein
MSSANHTKPSFQPFEPSSASPVGPSADRSLGWVANVLTRRKHLIAIALGIGLLGGFVASLRHDRFTSSGKIQVRPGSSSMYRVDTSMLGGGDSNAKLQSDVAVLTSDTLELRVAKELDLASNKDFISKQYGAFDDPLEQDHLLEQFRAACTADLTPKSEIITITCTTKSKLLSAKIVNTLITDYITRTFEARTDASQRVYGWLSVQLNDLKNNVERDQEKLIDLEKKLGVLGLDQTHNIVTQSLEDLTKAAGEAKMARIIAEARYRSISSSQPDLVEGGNGILASPMSPVNSQVSLLNTLRQDQVKLAKEYAALLAQYGKNYPDVKSTKAQLDETNKAVTQEQNRVLAQYRESYDAAKSNESMTTATLEAQKTDAFQRQGDMVNFAILQHQYEANRTLYEGLLQRLREAGIVSGLESSEIDIVDMGRLAGRPNGHGLIVLLIMGLFAGTLLGLAAAFFADAMDTRIRDFAEIEAVVQLPSLALLPHSTITPTPAATAANDALPSVEIVRDPNSVFAEEIRALRTAILFSGIGTPPKAIVFTSSMQGEGKSLVCANAAAALARPDARVLLIDGDMRRPTQHKLFNTSKRAGLSDVLARGLSLQEAAQPVAAVPGLYLMTSGPIPPSPADILSSGRFAALMEEARAQFTHIIIDTPPALHLTDPILLAEQSDAVVLVVREGVASRPTLQRVRQLFSQSGARLIGMVLNDVTQQGIGYGYGVDYAYFSDAKSKT